MKWDGRYVAGVSSVSGLRRVTDVIHHREGGDPSSERKSPGLTHFDASHLERGMTHDQAFEEWANSVWDVGAGAGAESALRNFRKDVGLELSNEAGQLVLAYRLFRCWPSEYTALPDLNAATSGVALQSLVLQTKGWERDLEIAEPSKPGKTE